MTAEFATEVITAVTEGRALAESRMLTTVSIQFAGTTAQDPVTGTQSPTYVTAFTTRARIKSSAVMVRESEAGGRTAAETTRQLHIPATSADPWADPRSARGVTALVTAVHATDDPSLLGVRVKLTGPAPGSQTTARRLQITEAVT